MANELKHLTVGTELTQSEYEAIGGHVFDPQATGDTMYASSATQLSRLAIGSTGDSLKVVAGIPAWSATFAADQTFLDDIDLAFGTGKDILARNRSTSAAADLEITDIIIGTSVHPGVAANSLLVSNITASGDMLFLTNRGGNSEAHMLFDASAGDTFFYARGVEMMKLAGGGNVEVSGTDFSVDATKKIYLDGGVNTYIHEVSVDKVELVVGSSILWNADDTAGVIMNPSAGAALDFQVLGDTAVIINVDASIDGLGFYGATPTAQLTGVAVSSAGIHAALVTLGLITA